MVIMYQLISWTSLESSLETYVIVKLDSTPKSYPVVFPISKILPNKMSNLLPFPVVKGHLVLLSVKYGSNSFWSDQSI